MAATAGMRILGGASGSTILSPRADLWRMMRQVTAGLETVHPEMPGRTMIKRVEGIFRQIDAIDGAAPTPRAD
jgi:hypothetical protein